MFSRRTLLSLLAASLLVAILLAIVSARADDADGDAASVDDGVLDVEDVDGEDSDVRRSKRFGGGESFDTFEDFARKQQEKGSKNQKKPQGGGGDSNKGGKKQDDKPKQQDKPKPKPESSTGDSSGKKPKPSSSSSSSSSSSASNSGANKDTNKLSVTERLALLTKGLNEVKGELTGTSRRLVRLSAAPDSTAVAGAAEFRSFNTTLNRASNLKALAKMLSTFGADYVVDSDALESASSRLSTLRFEHRTLVKKIDDAAKAEKKKQREASADSYPARDAKIQELQQGIAVATAIIDLVVDIEQTQRVVHKRLVRAAKLVLPSVVSYTDRIAQMLEDRYNQVRGIRDGDIDGAAPSSSGSSSGGADAKSVREERRNLKNFVAKIKGAQTLLKDYQKHVDAQGRRGRGITKEMEPLFVATNLLARFGVCEDVLHLLVAADEAVKSKAGGGGAVEPGAMAAMAAMLVGGDDGELFLRSRHAVEIANSAEMAKLTPTTITGVVFGLDSLEFLGLCIAVVLPFVVVKALYAVVEWRVLGAYEKQMVDLGGKAAASRFKGAGQRLGGTGSDGGAGNTAKKPRANYVLVVLFFLGQLLLLLVPLDLPGLADRVEDAPITHKGPDVTLPSVLFAALRLQVSNATQFRLFGLLLGMLLYQAYNVALAFATTSQSIAEFKRVIRALSGDSDDDNGGDGAGDQQDAGAAARRKAAGSKGSKR